MVFRYRNASNGSILGGIPVTKDHIAPLEDPPVTTLSSPVEKTEVLTVRSYPVDKLYRLSKVLYYSDSWLKVKGIMARILMALVKRNRQTIRRQLSVEDCERAESVMGGLVMKKTVEMLGKDPKFGGGLFLFWENGFCWTRVRLCTIFKSLLDPDKLMVTSCKCRLAKLIKTHCPAQDHRRDTGGEDLRFDGYSLALAQVADVINELPLGIRQDGGAEGDLLPSTPNLVHWVKYDVKVGKAGYSLCRVKDVDHDAKGLVRTVRVLMRPRDKREKSLPYKSKKMTILELPIQRLVLICSAEDVEKELIETSVEPINSTDDRDRVSVGDVAVIDASVGEVGDDQVSVPGDGYDDKDLQDLQERLINLRK